MYGLRLALNWMAEGIGGLGFIVVLIYFKANSVEQGYDLGV